MPEMRITPRERLVLTAIIEQYIATGEPVASQTVAQSFAHREGMSSATIRNVMVSLAEDGLLEQPHTSAGRVPTAAAFLGDFDRECDLDFFGDFDRECDLDFFGDLDRR